MSETQRPASQLHVIRYGANKKRCNYTLSVCRGEMLAEYIVTVRYYRTQ